MARPAPVVGERSMRITWELETPMPAGIDQETKVAAG